MNKLEKAVYDAVKGNPKLKIGLRNIYQSFYDLLPDKDNWSINPITVKEGYFFGFHDVTPFSADEKYVLSNKLLIGEEKLRMPDGSDPLAVGFWDEKLENFNTIKNTCAWNYHKGCRLQWRGNSSTEFVFNDVENDCLGAFVYNITDEKMRFIDYPVDTVSHNGKYATGFSYERLNSCMPGYGYPHKDDSFLAENAPDKTGLFVIDIENNSSKMIVSLAQLIELEHDGTMDDAVHFVSHSEFSTDDTRIAFLHRWSYLDNTYKRYTRLITCNLDGSDLKVSETTGMVSHYVWDGKHGILAYSRVNDVDGHYIFPDYTVKNPIRVASKLNSDGHQSYVPDTDCFVTDTYPDKYRHARLYLCDIPNDRVEKIADLKSFKKFQSPSADKHWACDLHPRVSPGGKYVCFDSVHTGKRSVCFMQLDEAIEKIQQTV